MCSPNKVLNLKSNVGRKGFLLVIFCSCTGEPPVKPPPSYTFFSTVKIRLKKRWHLTEVPWDNQTKEIHHCYHHMALGCDYSLCQPITLKPQLSRLAVLLCNSSDSCEENNRSEAPGVLEELIKKAKRKKMRKVWGRKKDQLLCLAPKSKEEVRSRKISWVTFWDTTGPQEN